MYILKCTVLLCVVLFSCEGQLLKPCGLVDLECIRESTQQFLENTANGIETYDVRPIDPMIVPSLDYDIEHDLGVIHHLKDLNVTGLKALHISDFQMDTESKKVRLIMELNVSIVGHISVEYTKQGKTFSGDYTSNGKAVAISSYGYDLKKDEKGVEHYVVGEETNTFKVDEEPTVNVEEKLLKEMSNDIDIADTRKVFLDNKTPIMKRSMEKLLEVAVPIVIHNLRQVAKYLPASAFFKT